jgi:hypothetical protein
MPRLRQDPHNSTDWVPLAAGTSPERIPDGPDLSFTRHSGLAFGQNDGSAPHVVLAAHAPGTHSISVVRYRFDNGLHACGTSLHHMIYLTLAHEEKIACRIDDRRLDHVARRGNLTIIPEGAICTADGAGSDEGLVLVVPKETLSFAAAERSTSGASVIERLEGEDSILLRLGMLLAQQVVEKLRGWASGLVRIDRGRHSTTHRRPPDRHAGGRQGHAIGGCVRARHRLHPRWRRTAVECRRTSGRGPAEPVALSPALPAVGGHEPVSVRDQGPAQTGARDASEPESLDGGDRRSDGLCRPESHVPLDAASVRRGPHTAGSKAPLKRRNLQAKRGAASHLKPIRRFTRTAIRESRR